MYKLITLVLFRIRLLFKSKIAVIMLFVLPLVFSAIFIGMGINPKGGSSRPDVGLVVEDCDECASVQQYIMRNTNYDWVELDLESAKQAVTEGIVLAAIIIPHDICDRAENSNPIFDVIVNNKTENYIPLSQYIDGVASQIHMFNTTLKVTDETFRIKETIDYVNSVPAIKIDYEQYQDNLADNQQKVTSSTTLTIGFTVMFMMFAIANNVSVIQVERKEYSWQRLIATGTSSNIITAGTMLAYFIVGWMQFAVVILFMKFVYGVNLGNVMYLILFGSIMIMTVVSFNMVIMALCNSKEQSDTFSTIIIVSTCMLGGVYWPIEFVPRAMQILGAMTPQYWMMKGLEYGLLNETSLKNISVPVTVLIGITLVFTMIVVKTLNSEKMRI